MDLGNRTNDQESEPERSSRSHRQSQGTDNREKEAHSQRQESPLSQKATKNNERHISNVKASFLAVKRSHLSPQPPIVPSLKTESENIARTHEQKARAFGERFFPPEPEADLSDMTNCVYPLELSKHPTIRAETIQRVISKLKSMTAPIRMGCPTCSSKSWESRW